MTTYDYEMEVLNVFRNIDEELASIERLLKTLIKTEDNTSNSRLDTYKKCDVCTTGNQYKEVE